MKTLTPQILALYLGCELLFEKCNYHFVHELQIHKGEKRKLTTFLLSELNADDGEVLASDSIIVKLLLRPLSSMTEEEEKEMVATQDDVRLVGYPKILLKTDSGETFLYMLRKGFDLFSLIEKGEAIDATKLAS